eukprot:scaffold23809_cov82-Attheya_sp.AAC.1
MAIITINPRTYSGMLFDLPAYSDIQSGQQTILGVTFLFHAYYHFPHLKKACTICDGRQTRVLDDGNGGASGIFEHQGHSVMLSMQQYAKWQRGNGGFVDGVGYGIFATWFHLCKSRLLQSGTILEVHGQRMIPRVVVICFGQTGLGYGGVGLIRHHIVRLVGVDEATKQQINTGSKKARHATALF